MGLGDVVSQILAKDVAAPDPVLAKRKTALMKELDADQKQDQKRKKRRKEDAAAKQRRADEQRAAASVVREKQMSKTATRAVVALFNAVAKHQHPEDFADR
jgi:hypothetical protein